MPSTVRKVMVHAAKDGLILQSHGSEHFQAVKIDYKTHRVTSTQKLEHDIFADESQLECHGVVGLITISSLHFLIVITRREQVAQFYNKPVFAITDVAILPLVSQTEANRAILAANKSLDPEHDASDFGDSESEDDQHSVTTEDPPIPPAVEDGPYTHQNKSNTSIAQDVAQRRALYGRFASQWFYKQVWGSKSQNKGNSALHSTDSELKSEIESYNHSTEVAETNQEKPEEIAEKEDVTDISDSVTNASALALLPKILRSIKMILASRSFYFAYDFNLTRRFSLQEKRAHPMSRDKLNPFYFWNQKMATAFFDAGQDALILPIIQGFVGQRTFSVQMKTQASGTEQCNSGAKVNATAIEEAATTGESRSYLLTLVSRRSVKRSGLRYLRRGIDDEGNCANTVETEQILSSPTWDKSSTIRSFVQIRGSIPLYFSQSPYSLKPTPMFHNSSSANEAAFKRHFQNLNAQYGAIQVAALVDKHGTEVSIGNAYKHMYETLSDTGLLNDVSFEWFDFHAECRGMKFENVQKLVTRLAPQIAGWGQTTIINDFVQTKQKGVIRTNCMDCLDRTNVAQSAFGQHVLQNDLRQDGYEIDLLRDTSTNWFNTLWADNGDAISRQYASTAALKGDFTRTRKRNWRGQVNDLGLTLSRYYSNMVNDYFSQTVIDFLLGNVSWKIFEDFENTMMSVDPGISVETARQTAIENCAKIVISNSTEDLIHGWTMLTPAQENTLRTLPFEEAVVLLTDAAVYCCKFDWKTEKVASYEKVDLRSILKIRLGTYVTSTFTETQLDDKLNQGLVVIFLPGKGDIIRVNTRSLSNAVKPESEKQSSADGGTGIFSWFASKTVPQTSRTLALKVIPYNSTVETHEDEVAQQETAQEIATRVSEEIKRAALGPDQANDYPHFIEKGDIISAVEAKQRTGYLEQLSHSIKKLVWT